MQHANSREQCLSRNLGINSSNMLHEIDDTARVSPLVIVPGNKLDKVGVKHDTGTGIKDGRAAIRLEISGNKGLITVSKDTLHLSLRLRLDDGADLLVGGGLSELARQVNNRHINGRDTECHSGELALKTGDDLARGSTSSTPVLTAGRVNHRLGGGHGMDSGHECLLDVELIMDGLDHGSKAVGGAGYTGDEVLRAIVLLGVDTHDNGLGVILGRG